MNKPLIAPEAASELLRCKRLYFRSCHRGMKEMDLILGGFAAHALSSMNKDQLDVYEQLLETDDDVLWAWVVGKTVPPAEFAALVAMIAAAPLAAA